MKTAKEYNDGKVFVNSLFPIELDNQVRIAAAQMRISRAEFVRLAVEEFLKNQGVQITSNGRSNAKEGVKE